MLEYDMIMPDGSIKHVSKVEQAVQRLRSFEPEDGYYLAFSGGKDSQCIYHLAVQAGVKFDAHYYITSVDPPELVQFIRQNYPDVARETPHDKDGKPITMWSLIERVGLPPTRLRRYCCKYLKETGGMGRVIVTGVRWAESPSRKNNQALIRVQYRKRADRPSEIRGGGYIDKRGSVIFNHDNDDARRLVEQCYRTNKAHVNPIVDWEDADVWEYLTEVVKVPHCKLYDEGFKRLGCIGCPMADAEYGLERWPKYKRMYLRTFDKMLQARRERGKETIWDTPEAVMDGWLGKAAGKQIDGQITIEDLEDI